MKKRQLVLDAFAEVALAGYAFDLTAEELQTGLQRLEQMVMEWSQHGIDIGYNTLGDAADLDNEVFLSAATDEAKKSVSAVVMNLAKRIAGGFGKQVAPSTLTAARESYRVLLAVAAKNAAQSLATGRDTGVLSSTQRGAW